MVKHHISHSRPLFPSVARLLQVYDIQDPEKIKGTGVRGMLTKGDVLAFLGKASSPTGTFNPVQSKPGSEAPKRVEAKVDKVRPIQYLCHLPCLTQCDASRWMAMQFVNLLSKACRRRPRRALEQVSTSNFLKNVCHVFEI